MQVPPLDRNPIEWANPQGANLYSTGASGPAAVRPVHAVNAVGLKVDIFSYANHAVAANPLCISVSKSLSLPIKTSTFSSCLLTTSKARCAMAVSTVSFSVMESFLCVQQGEKFGQKHMEFARKKQTPSENNFRQRFCMPTCHGLGIVSII